MRIQLPIATKTGEDSEIDPIDIPVADLRAWRRHLHQGTGRMEGHPYRLVRPAAISISPFRVYATPPADTSTALPKGRPATASESKWASEGLPIDVEFKTERIEGGLWQVAADFADCYETANTDVVQISERRIYADQVCQFLRFRLLHLWRPLVDATVFGKTMAAIGRDYGGNKEDSAKLGRQKVIDGLLLARDTFWDINDANRKAQASMMKGAPVAVSPPVTLGRKNADLPTPWHIAANDNRKAIRSVA